MDTRIRTIVAVAAVGVAALASGSAVASTSAAAASLNGPVWGDRAGGARHRRPYDVVRD